MELNEKKKQAISLAIREAIIECREHIKRMYMDCDLVDVLGEIQAIVETAEVWAELCKELEDPERYKDCQKFLAYCELAIEEITEQINEIEENNQALENSWNKTR